MHKRTTKRDAMIHLNIIPLIDVMLVLLAVFMVTAPMMNVFGVHLPTVSGEKKQPERSFVVTIRSSGMSFFDGKRTQEVSSVNHLKTIVLSYLESKDAAVFSIAADEGVSYGQVMSVFSVIRSLGFSNVHLMIQGT